MPAEQLQTLSRAIAVLDCFTHEGTELGVREVARKVNLSSSATGRLLSALKELGILSQNPETRTYSMGAKVLSWAGVYNATLDVRNRSLPFLQELHQSTRETISLYVLEGIERVCVERLESPQGIRMVTRIGRRLPLYAGSAGKAILAFLPPERQEEIIDGLPLEPFTPKTFTDPTVLRKELKKVRAQGCAISFGEWIADAAGVAAPIFNQDGNVIGALSISGPASRFNKETVALFCSEVKRFASHISLQMGFDDGISDSSGSVKNDHSRED